MKTKLLIPSLVAAGMLAAPFAMAQQGQGQMPGQTQPSGPTPMPAPGQAGAMPPSATPMPPASQGKQPYGTPPQGRGMSQGSQGQGMPQGSQGMPPRGSDSMSSPGRSGSAPMGAQSPYAPQKWNKGDKLPTEFRDRQYVIDKYKDYNLPAPRKGYHWVGVGADYYQVSSNGTIYSVGPGGG